MYSRWYIRCPVVCALGDPLVLLEVVIGVSRATQLCGLEWNGKQSQGLSLWESGFEVRSP